MKFLNNYNKHLSLFLEVDEVDQADATSPDPNATPEPDNSQPTQVAPEGYVDLVKLLAKAVAMNFPAGALDEIFRTGITAESAFSVQTALEAAIKQNEMYGDNPERLQNINYKKFSDSINAGNFIKKYKQLLAVMKQQDPYITNNV